MYAAYARLPGRSTCSAGLLLLEAVADPNADCLWGGTYRFSVLTGIFGDGEGGKKRLPEHPERVPFARAVLDKSAQPNDSQGAYNRCFTEDDTHLELMLAHGLHAQNQPGIDLFMNAEMDISLAATLGKIGRIDARSAQDPSWINAPFARVRPHPERDWPNEWAPPLWFAAMNGRAKAARHLLRKGADAGRTDPAGQSIAQYAEQSGHHQIADMVRAAQS